ncbi:hypothetical protein B0T24DRAFT_28310 [Lasiosphaeria ovina]|uniref:Uncharacterized protein n=1 Tax=Lasiosphaeria ovina TaxID=92902 RepID=A0AAE0TX93_9PEZI|nr:hypothetical protein B0T24DRAFT_28310 [Lasiosphaeria ovina]
MAGGARKYSDEQITFILARAESTCQAHLAHRFCEKFNVDPAVFGSKQVKYIRGAYKRHPGFTGRDQDQDKELPMSEEPPQKVRVTAAAATSAQSNQPRPQPSVPSQRAEKNTMSPADPKPAPHHGVKAQSQGAPVPTSPQSHWKSQRRKAAQNGLSTQAPPQQAPPQRGLGSPINIHMPSILRQNNRDTSGPAFQPAPVPSYGMKRNIDGYTKTPLQPGTQFGIMLPVPENKPPIAMVAVSPDIYAETRRVPLPYAPGCTPSKADSADQYGVWYSTQHDECPIRLAHRHDWDGGVHFKSIAYWMRTHLYMRSVTTHDVSTKGNATIDTSDNFNTARQKAQLPAWPMVSLGDMALNVQKRTAMPPQYSHPVQVSGMFAPTTSYQNTTVGISMGSQPNRFSPMPLAMPPPMPPPMAPSMPQPMPQPMPQSMTQPMPHPMVSTMARIQPLAPPALPLALSQAHTLQSRDLDSQILRWAADVTQNEQQFEALTHQLPPEVLNFPLGGNDIDFDHLFQTNLNDDLEPDLVADAKEEASPNRSSTAKTPHMGDDAGDFETYNQLTHVANAMTGLNEHGAISDPSKPGQGASAANVWFNGHMMTTPTVEAETDLNHNANANATSPEFAALSALTK